VRLDWAEACLLERTANQPDPAVPANTRRKKSRRVRRRPREWRCLSNGRVTFNFVVIYASTPRLGIFLLTCRNWEGYLAGARKNLAGEAASRGELTACEVLLTALVWTGSQSRRLVEDSITTVPPLIKPDSCGVTVPL
jgi:hypothetical protein